VLRKIFLIIASVLFSFQLLFNYIQAKLNGEPAVKKYHPDILPMISNSLRAFLSLFDLTMKFFSSYSLQIAANCFKYSEILIFLIRGR